MKRDIFGKTELDRELAKDSGEVCSECGKALSINVYQYSTRTYGRLLCYDDQKKFKEHKHDATDTSTGQVRCRICGLDESDIIREVIFK